MKKFLNISLLTLVALSSLSLTSCLNEMEDIFDDDAVIRMNNAKDQYFDILTSNGGKWELEYFSNTGEPGYTYILTFEKDGTVTMSGHNKWINYIKNNSLSNSAFGSAKSMWDLVADNSLVLTFNTYNDYFHFFASPDKVPTGGAGGDGIASTEGYGHEGDYEFNIMKYSGDTIYLTGKKYDLPMIMTRIDPSTDDATFLSETAMWKKTSFNTTIPYVYLILPDGKRWIVEPVSILSDGNLRMYREGDDRITSSEFHNTIITRGGMAFMRPITLDGYTIQRFTRQADGTMLCVEDNQTKMIGFDLVQYLFLNDGTNMLQWKADIDMKNNVAPDLGGEYRGLVTEINTELPKIPGEKSGSRLVEAGIMYDSKTMNSFVFKLMVRRTSDIKPEAYFAVTVEDLGNSQIKLHFDARDTYAERLYNGSEKIKQLIERLAANTYNLTSVSLLGPSAIKMAESGNADNYLIWNLQ